MPNRYFRQITRKVGTWIVAVRGRLFLKGGGSEAYLRVTHNRKLKAKDKDIAFFEVKAIDYFGREPDLGATLAAEAAEAAISGVPSVDDDVNSISKKNSLRKNSPPKNFAKFYNGVI